MKKFLPVIHCIDPYTEGGIGHALANARIAFKNGADGIFLIGHNLVHTDLFYIYESVRKQSPREWIGINFLDIPIKYDYILEMYTKEYDSMNALWFDDLPKYPLSLPSFIELFGGVAFKYKKANGSDEELAKECAQAVAAVTTATTSGNKTGEAPSVEKLAKIKALLQGKIPLALASGVSADNVVSFLPFVDTFLVATSITKRDSTRGDHEYLVPEKVKELANLIHG